MRCTGVFCLLKVWMHAQAALTSEKRETNSSSHHGDAVGCPLSLYCKFGINLRLNASYLAGGNEKYRVDKTTKFQVQVTVQSEKRESSSSSQHGDTIGCSLSV